MGMGRNYTAAVSWSRRAGRSVLQIDRYDLGIRAMDRKPYWRKDMFFVLLEALPLALAGGSALVKIIRDRSFQQVDHPTHLRFLLLNQSERGTLLGLQNQSPFQLYVQWLRSQEQIKEALALVKEHPGKAPAKALLSRIRERAAEQQLPKDVEKHIKGVISELEKASDKNRRGLSKGAEAELAAAEISRFEGNFGMLSK
jgi:hypothetical protein